VPPEPAFPDTPVEDDLRQETASSGYRGLAASAFAGGTAFMLAAGVTALANRRCDDCTGGVTPLILLGAGGAAWTAGVIFLVIDPTPRAQKRKDDPEIAVVLRLPWR
jgi:hypothetical protein